MDAKPFAAKITVRFGYEDVPEKSIASPSMQSMTAEGTMLWFKSGNCQGPQKGGRGKQAPLSPSMWKKVAEKFAPF